MNFTIKKKLLFILGVLGFLIILMFFNTWWSLKKQANDAVVINLAGRQRMLSQKMSKEILIFKKSTESENLENNKLKESVLNSMKVFDMTLTSLEKSGKAPLTLDLSSTKFKTLPKAKEPALSQLVKVQNIWKSFSENILYFLENPGSEESLNYLMENNTILLAEMNKAVLLLQKQSEKKISVLIRQLIFLIFIGIFAIVIAFLVISKIVLRLKKIEGFCIEYGNGNFAIDTNISGDDELGRVGLALQEMQDKLANSFGEIIQLSSSLSESSGLLNKISKEVSTISTDTIEKSNTVASATEELSSNMKNIADNMHHTNEDINTVSIGTEEMNSSINEIAQNASKSTNITKNAVNQAESASDQVKELGKAAHEIVKVTDTIAEISNQTNLLALNATIEAARAGEAGKGFAVVANEIKELAKQTAIATEEIAKQLNGVQSTSEKTAIEIGSISNIINEIDTIVGTIAAAVEEQNATTSENSEKIANASRSVSEINENVSQGSLASKQIAEEIIAVNDSANNINISANQVQNSSEELSQMVEKLKGIVGQFKV